MYELIIFDWDGTIIDSAQKIANCIKLSAHDVDLPIPTDAKAKSVIGLGLHEAMRVIFGDISAAQVDAMVERYRYYFVEGDKTGQALFDGVEKGLCQLQEAGAVLAVATGKSRIGLERVFNELGMREHFITTRCADETRSKPHPQMLHEILDFTAIEPDKTIMVGDTTYDMLMAGAAKVDGLGVSYGVHSRSDLIESNAKHVAESFGELIDWLLDGRVTKAYN